MGAAHVPPLPNESLALQLAEFLEARRVDQTVARSLLQDWSERGWTARQAGYAARLVREAPLPEGETRAIAPYPYERGGYWCGDTRRERQALRGRKSGIMRRWRTRDRDARIRKLRREGRSLAEIAAAVSLSRSGVVHILKRVISTPLPRLAAVRRTISNVPIRYPRAVLERLPGRTTTIRQALMRWCGLRACRDLPDVAVRAEAWRLNGALERPLPVRRLGDTVNRVLRERRCWASP